MQDELMQIKEFRRKKNEMQVRYNFQSMSFVVPRRASFRFLIGGLSSGYKDERASSGNEVEICKQVGKYLPVLNAGKRSC